MNTTGNTATVTLSIPFDVTFDELLDTYRDLNPSVIDITHLPADPYPTAVLRFPADADTLAALDDLLDDHTDFLS